MKKLLCVALLLIISVHGFTQTPSEEMEKEINTYLQALSASDYGTRLVALKKLDQIKSQYPDMKMKAFDNFIKSKAMKQTTQLWKESLHHKSEWVRHSTLHALVMLKSDFPHLDMSAFNKTLQDMIDNDHHKHIQVDAKIAYIYINDPVIASKIKLDETNIMEGDLFTKIHLEMDKLFETAFMVQ